METLAPLNSSQVAAAIGWFYLLTNSLRVFTYIPQIVAVWRCTDGARAISLFTWCSWTVSHTAAIAYGALVMHDAFFVAISTINFTGCATITMIAAHKRRLFSPRKTKNAAPAGPTSLSRTQHPMASRGYRRSFSALPRRHGDPQRTAAAAAPPSAVALRSVVDPRRLQ